MHLQLTDMVLGNVFQPFLRFWQTKLPKSMPIRNTRVSTLLEILENSALGRPRRTSSSTVSTLLEILVHLYPRLRAGGFDVSTLLEILGVIHEKFEYSSHLRCFNPS